MKIYLTTDTHFGHEKIKEYCNRPDNFEELIIDNLCKIEDDAMLIHLGDFCLDNSACIYWMEKFTNSSKCKKILTVGNHDNKSDNWYLTHGFDFVCKRFSLKFQDKEICFSHKPSFWDGSWDLNICGHFHNTNHHVLETGTHTDFVKILSIENTNYKPILLEDFIK